MKRFLQRYTNIRTATATVFLILLTAITVSAQQQAVYTQFMENLTPLNSAAALLDPVGSVSTLVREQYVGIQGAPNTFILNGNMPIESINGAAGLVIYNDNFAVEHQFLVNAYFAKGVQLSPTNYLSVSLDAGIRNYVADYAGLAPGDPVFADDIRQTMANIGFGVMLYGPNYYLGASVPQLTFQSLGDASLLDNNYFRNHYYFAGAYLAELENNIKIKPAILVSYVRGVPIAADFSSTFYFTDVMGVGVDVRTTAEMAFILTFNVKGFKLGYSYQFGTSDINPGGVNNATHEVTLSYRFGKNADKPKLL
jgi:type IX secretion system PorP/SprF family membrane protein